MTDTATARRDFFVSFNQADRPWATWIAWVLEEAGYTVFFQDWDFRGNFVEHMDRGHSLADRTVAVLSDNYLGSDFTTAEWSARYAQDPVGREDRLVPVRIDVVTNQTILGPLIYADLLGCDEVAAEELLLGRVRMAADAKFRNKPKRRPGFPGIFSRQVATKPQFPGKCYDESGVVSTENTFPPHFHEARMKLKFIKSLHEEELIDSPIKKQMQQKILVDILGAGSRQ